MCTLWNYYKNISTDPITDSESFKYKTSITGKTANDGITKRVKFSVPLKYLSNFWKILDMPLNSCEASLTLTWSKNCVLTDITTTDAQRDNPAIAAPTGATLKIKDTKLYVPVVPLSAENDNKLLEQLKTRFKKTIKWNKYRSEMSNQTKNNNLNYLIDPLFENETDRTSFKNYYVPQVEMKNFKLVINGNPFFEIPVKNKEEAYEAIIEISKNND